MVRLYSRIRGVISFPRFRARNRSPFGFRTAAELAPALMHYAVDDEEIGRLFESIEQ